MRVSPVWYPEHRPIRRVVAREHSEEAGDLLIVDAPKARVGGQVLSAEGSALGFKASPVQSVAGRPGFIQRQAVRPRERGLELESGLTLKLWRHIAVKHQRTVEHGSGPDPATPGTTSDESTTRRSAELRFRRQSPEM